MSDKKKVPEIEIADDNMKIISEYTRSGIKDIFFNSFEMGDCIIFRMGDRSCHAMILGFTDTNRICQKTGDAIAEVFISYDLQHCRADLIHTDAGYYIWIHPSERDVASFMACRIKIDTIIHSK